MASLALTTAVSPEGWLLFWGLMALILARRCVLAILDPAPARVQMAVKNAIFSLIVIHAGICLGVCGVFWGCLVLILLAPTLVLGRWIAST